MKTPVSFAPVGTGRECFVRYFHGSNDPRANGKRQIHLRDDVQEKNKGNKKSCTQKII